MADTNLTTSAKQSKQTLTPEQAKAVQGILGKSLEPAAILAEFLNDPGKSERLDSWLLGSVFAALPQGRGTSR